MPDLFSVERGKTINERRETPGALQAPSRQQRAAGWNTNTEDAAAAALLQDGVTNGLEFRSNPCIEVGCIVAGGRH